MPEEPLSDKPTWLYLNYWPHIDLNLGDEPHLKFPHPADAAPEWWATQAEGVAR